MRIKFNFMSVMIIALTTLCGCVVPYDSIGNEKHIELNFYSNGGLYNGKKGQPNGKQGISRNWLYL